MPGKGRVCIVCKKTRASCAFAGQKASHCGKCKENGMTNTTLPKCIECKITIPNYGLSGGKPTHCKECKTDTMVDVRAQKCSKCKLKQPTYGKEGESPKYCYTCKEPDMIDVRSKMCEICNKKQPFFGEKCGKPVRCGDCKTDTMIDLISFKCVICNIKHPVFGLSGKKATHCKDCKLDELIDVENKKCIICNKIQPTYGCPIIKNILRCKSCKLDTDTDLRHKLCKTEYCETRAHVNLRGYCSWCFQHLFPDDPLTKKIPRKTYEIEVASTILGHNPEYKHDMRLSFGKCDCVSRRRIDLWRVIGNTLIAIEVDEHQHRRYDPADEEIRYDDLFMQFSGKWIFIRFNPNSFKDGRKTKNPPMKERLPALLEVVRLHELRAKEEKNTDLIEIHRLFFDR